MASTNQPTQPPADRAEQLLSLAQQQFGTLTAAEDKLFRAVARGEPADFRAGSEEEDNPLNAQGWPVGRALPADRIAWLCTDPQARALVTYRGVIATGVRVDGDLVLIYAQVPFPLVFRNCAFQSQIALREASLRALSLRGTYTKAIIADGLQVEGSVTLSDGFLSEGQINLMGATISGALFCVGGRFLNPGGMALNAGALKVSGAIFFRKPFRAEG